MDNMNRIATTDNRLIRRIVRDYRTRGNDATATLRRWESVRRGEDLHIFPNQEQADVMFNSSLFYEIAVLKSFVEPLLHEVPDTMPEYGEARRLLKYLDQFTRWTAVKFRPLRSCANLSAAAVLPISVSGGFPDIEYLGDTGSMYDAGMSLGWAAVSLLMFLVSGVSELSSYQGRDMPLGSRFLMQRDVSDSC